MQKHVTRIQFNVFLKNFICYLGLLALLLVFSPMGAKAQSYDFSISRKQATLLSVIEQVEQTSKYRFFYNNNVIDINQKVNIDVNNASIEILLNSLFKKSEISYSIEGKKILLAQKGEILSKGIQENRQTFKSVAGSVVDEKGEPIIGASVVEKGTGNGVITDIDGKFSLPLRGGKNQIQISYIGYITTTVKVASASLKVILKEDAQTLEEVVVVGFGTQKKVNLTGAVSSVKMDDVIGNRPVTSVTAALESAVPGLQINKVSGKPGVTVNTNIRGVTSINGGGPLVLVDNVPMDLDLVDPNDIEYVSVLKDAAASAIYGARAAFGVILVTTKQGKKDTPIRVNYSNNFSFSKLTSTVKKATPMKTLEYYKYLGLDSYWPGQNIDKWIGYMEQHNNEGMYPEGYVWGEDGYRYNLAATDSYKDMMENFGFQQTHNLAVQGGGARSTYRVSFGMVDEDGILVTDKDRYRRYNASGFISMDATDWFTAQLDTKYANSTMSTAQGSIGNANIWNAVKETLPMAPLGYGGQSKDDTELMPIATPRHGIEMNEPKINRISDIRLLGRIILKPLPGWNITGEYTYNRHWTSQRTVNKYVETLGPDSARPIIDNSLNSYSMYNTFYDRNTMNIFSSYQRRIGDHDFSVMGGFNQELYHYEYLAGTRKDLLYQELPSLGLGTGEMITSDAFSELALRSLFYRLNYSYKDRYLFETNGRYDGSSRYRKEDRFGFFPSFSAAWRISEEAFMEQIRQTFDNIKLRASWGNIGNQATGGYYQYIPTIATSRPKWIPSGGQEWATSLTVPDLISESLTWETVSTLDFGIDFSLLGKLSVSGDYYIRDTKDMLGPSSPLPSVLGVTAPKTNVASLRTKGWEVSVEWKDKINEDFNYRIGFNLYDSQSEITDYHNPTGLLSSNGNLSLRKGMNFGDIWGYETDRYLTVDDFNADGSIKKDANGKPIVPLVKNQKVVYPGDILFVDQNKDGVVDDGENTVDNPGDQIVIGNNTPRYQFGINGGVQYKNFDFSFFLSGVGKRDMWFPLFPAQGVFAKTVETFQLDCWSEDNLNAYYPRMSATLSTGANTSRQTKYVQDGSYIRLKNVTLGYNVPKALCNKCSIQNLKIFFSGENLFTIHHLPAGYMPDGYDTSVGSLALGSAAGGDSTGGNLNYPLMRQFSFGINLTF